MSVNAKDLAAGAFFVLAGVGFCMNAAKNLTVGTAVAMGPGYFPIVLGLILGLLGLTIVIGAVGNETSPIEGISWRGIFLIGLAPVVFGVSIDALGLVPALFLSTLVAALASRNMGWRNATVLSLGLTLFSVVIFIYGLGLPLQVISPSMRGWVN